MPVSVAGSDYEYFYSPLDGMLIHRRVTPSIKFVDLFIHLSEDSANLFTTAVIRCISS